MFTWRQVLREIEITALLLFCRSSMAEHILGSWPKRRLQNILAANWHASIASLLYRLETSESCRKSCQILHLLLNIPADVRDRSYSLDLFFFVPTYVTGSLTVVERIVLYKTCLLRCFHPSLWRGLPDQVLGADRDASRNETAQPDPPDQPH